jgi:hypothetical protein
MSTTGSGSMPPDAAAAALPPSQQPLLALPPPKPPFFTRVRRKLQAVSDIVARGTDGFGVWFWSVLATIAAPCLPIFIEFLSTGTVKANSYFITAAVLSAAFAVSTGHTFFRALYGGLFVINLILDTVSGPFSASIEHYAGILLLLTAVLHAVERFWWHVVYDRPFP